MYCIFSSFKRALYKLVLSMLSEKAKLIDVSLEAHIGTVLDAMVTSKLTGLFNLADKSVLWPSFLFSNWLKNTKSSWLYVPLVSGLSPQVTFQRGSLLLKWYSVYPDFKIKNEAPLVIIIQSK